MNNALCGRSRLAVGLYVRHDIVPDLTFVLLRLFVIDVAFMRFQFVDLRFRDRKTKFHFTLRKRDPKLSPKTKTLFIAEVFLHLATCIAGIQRVLI